MIKKSRIRHIIPPVLILVQLIFALSQHGMAQSSRGVSSPVRFAGLHFDFHASLEDTNIGKTFTAEMIDSLFTIAQPDFIQVDCKGHPGISSYPTRVGNGPNHPDKDILMTWREVTAKHHVALYVHYSGVWDGQAIRLHPSWARINSKQQPEELANSLFGPYEDSLMIPQLKELATVYKVDGAWIDGDCWTLKPDYGVAARTAFMQEGKFDSVPLQTSDPHYFEWMTFNRTKFHQYMNKYMSAVHNVAPAFKVTSNWSFSSMMPEKVDAPVDFLSGDVAGENSMYSAAFESRCLALQGKAWDLMSWSFAMSNNVKVPKPMIQLRQEAAEVLAMGGGFQTYWTQNRDGSPELQYYRLMADIIHFSKVREPYTFGGTTVPQIGLLYSTYSWERIPNEDLYSGHDLQALRESLNCLMNSQYPVDILMDHQLDGRLEKYPLIVVPEWTNIDPHVHDRLVEYAKAGGRLIIIGARAVKEFSNELGIDPSGAIQQDTTFYAVLNNNISGQRANFLPVTLREGTKSIGQQSRADDLRFLTRAPLAVYRALGKGMIAGVLMDIGSSYHNRRTPFLPHLMQSVVAQMNVDFISKVSGSSLVHQVVTRKDGKLFIHLINAGGPHDNPRVETYDELPMLKNIKVAITLRKAPRAIRMQPENKPLTFKYAKSQAVVTIAELKDYSILQVDE